jgi:hypothetical protein
MTATAHFGLNDANTPLALTSVYHASSGSGGSSAGSGPLQRVLGAQTTILPVGAPNTGFGGASMPSPLRNAFISLTLLLGIATFRRLGVR